jgi:hypothetical protein
MGPSWKELIESGELQRILDRGVKHKGQPKALNQEPVRTHPTARSSSGERRDWGNLFPLANPDEDEERVVIVAHHISASRRECVEGRAG